jgi:hypothetical protein
MTPEDYHNAAIGIIGADRMSLGLPIVPSKKYGDMEKVRELTEQRDRLAEACKKLMAIIGETNSLIDDYLVSEDEMDEAWNIAEEALQSLTTKDHE